MASPRSLLSQVKQLKAAQEPRPSPIAALYGSVDAFAAECMAGVEASKLCPVDMPVVMDCLRRWERDGEWNAGRRGNDGVWKR